MRSKISNSGNSGKIRDSVGKVHKNQAQESSNSCPNLKMCENMFVRNDQNPITSTVNCTKVRPFESIELIKEQTH